MTIKEANIRKMDWVKRRDKYLREIEAVRVVDISGFEAIQDHKCTISVLYTDGVTYNLDARINQNDITKKWTIHGIDHTGKSVLLDIII